MLPRAEREAMRPIVLTPANPWSWKILVNGYIDEFGYSRGFGRGNRACAPSLGI